MIIVSKGQASSCSVPVLQLFAVDPIDGFMKDVVSASFTITDSTGAAVVTDVAVNLANCADGGHRLDCGRYVADWAGPITANPNGIWSIAWTYEIENPPTVLTTRQVTRQFEVVDAGLIKNPLFRYYTSLIELDALGFRAKGKSLILAMELASRYIEKFTGNVFEPTPKRVRLDGSGTTRQLLNEPIVAIGDIFIDISPFQPSELPIDPTSVRVYNRHLSQNLLSPDDRDNPRIEFFQSFDRQGSPRQSFSRLFFQRGEQNVAIQGVYGYTEPDGTPYGSTPQLISLAAQLLLNRNLTKPSDSEGRLDNQRAQFIEELRTRDQQVKYNFPNVSGGHHALVGGFTGDPEIDTILSMFQKPIMLAAT